MMQPVQASGIAVFVPVIQIKVMQECTAHQLSVAGAKVQPVVDKKAQAGNTDDMVVG